MNRQLLKLKLEKKLVEEKLKSTDSDYQRLIEILGKKEKQKKQQSRVEDFTLTKEGLPVSEYVVAAARRAESIRLPTIQREKNPLKEITECDFNFSSRAHNILKAKADKLATEKIKERESSKAQRQPRTKKYPRIAVPESLLPNRYIRGELPCTIEHGANGHYLSWVCPLENIDYDYYLPLFFDGLQCTQHPIKFLARQGVEDLLFAAKGNPSIILSCLDKLIRPLRNALSKYDPDVTLAVIRVIQQMVLGNPEVGEPLMSHSKQFLAPLTAYMDQHRNIGDTIDYGQRRSDDIAEEIRKALEILEEYGGRNSLQRIKFSVPLCKPILEMPTSILRPLLIQFLLKPN